MDPKNNKNDLGRRVSMGNSIRISIDSGDDDYGMGMGAIADGFRPGPGPGATTEDTQPSSSLHANFDSSRPSSALKPQQSESHPSRQDDVTPAQSSSRLIRSSSISTTSTATPFVHAESPYQGPSGPSHPYQLYPQNVRLARTMSGTTNSTEAVSETSYSGPRGPAHPYTLYPQGTVQDSSDMPAATTVPLGFHGLPDQYQRRMGPDGDDLADMIGPDGHTEQLPPYTRYPEEDYGKAVNVGGSTGLVGAGATITTNSAGPVSALHSIPGAGGLGLATRNPEFESMDDLGSPQSRYSTRSIRSDESEHEINAAAAMVSEKGKPLSKWQVWMRRRACGIVPIWAIGLTALVLLLMGAILGGVIGSFLGKSSKPHHREGSPNSSPTPSMTFDALPTSTPTDLPALPTGRFGLPLSMPSAKSNNCFNDTTQSKAWTCMVIPAQYYLEVNRNPDPAKDKGEYSVTVNCNESWTMENNVFSYGEQPPVIQNPATMSLVIDTSEPGRGPAWYHVAPYTKTVIVRESDLPAPGSNPTATSKNRRTRRNGPPGLGGVQIKDFKRMGVIQPGEKPWVCNWPQTFLQIFIYPQQNSSWALSTSATPQPGQTIPPGDSNLNNGSPSSGVVSSTAPPDGSVTAPPSTVIQSEDDDHDDDDDDRPNTSDVPQNEQALSSESYPFSSFGPPPWASRWVSEFDKRDEAGATIPPTPTETSPSDGTAETPSDATGNSAPGQGGPGPVGGGGPGGGLRAPPTPWYPRVIKMEERRTSGAPVPECTQYEIKGDGQLAEPITDDDGKPVIITLWPPPHGTVAVDGSMDDDDDLDEEGSYARRDLLRVLPSGEERKREKEREMSRERRSGRDFDIGRREAEDDSSLLRRQGGPETNQCSCVWFHQ